MSNSKKQALGRGLGALLNQTEKDPTAPLTSGTAIQAGHIVPIPLTYIQTNPFQPRTEFDEDALQELTESILQFGIIQPITVRKMGFDHYQLISGERRFRASQRAGLTEIPAYIRIADDQAMLEMALIENIQRENLDPVEIALSYKRLMDECQLTHEALSERVSKQRSTVTNYLRLLKLPIPIQKALRTGELSMGHAKSLVNIEPEDRKLAVFALVLEQDLSVRQMEALARSEKHKPVQSNKQKRKSLATEDQIISKQLHKVFGTRASYYRNLKGQGRFSVTFKNAQELQHLLNYFSLQIPEP
jgi:ParB family chromosome partitioning protein